MSKKMGFAPDGALSQRCAVHVALRRAVHVAAADVERRIVERSLSIY